MIFFLKFNLQKNFNLIIQINILIKSCKFENKCYIVIIACNSIILMSSRFVMFIPNERINEFHH